METQIESTVARVTLYPDRARVVRCGAIEVDVATTRLIVADLPLSLDPASVRVAGRGTARVTIAGVDVERTHHQDSPIERVRDLEGRLESATDELRTLADRRAVLSSEAAYLEGLRGATLEYARGLAFGRATIEDQQRLSRFISQRDGEVREQQQAIDREQRGVERLVDQLRAELEQLRSVAPRVRLQARVDVVVATAGRFELSLTYVVDRASWRPLYDVRLTPTDGGHSLEVTYLAQLTQQTGEDWSGVAMQVSTARPNLNQRPQDLGPWYLDFAPPPRPPMPSAPMVAMAATSSRAPVMMAPEIARNAFPREAEVAIAEVTGSDLAVSFAIAGSVDLRTDGSPHKVTIARLGFKPRLDYVCVPKHNDAAFRRLRFVNDSTSPLLAGAANLFVGDEYIGVTSLAWTPPGGELDLLFGVEDRVSVKRRLIKREVDKKFMRDERRTRFAYQIELESLLEGNAMIEVKDHFPVARNEGIKVELERTRPEPSERTDLNLMEWRVELAAGAKTVIEYEFRIEHPRQQALVGLGDL